MWPELIWVHHIFFCKSFILVKVSVDPEPVLGTLGARQKYTLDRVPVHHMASCVVKLKVKLCFFYIGIKLLFPFN